MFSSTQFADWFHANAKRDWEVWTEQWGIVPNGVFKLVFYTLVDGFVSLIHHCFMERGDYLHFQKIILDEFNLT